MLNKLKEYENIARRLEPEPTIRKQILSAVQDYTETFINDIYSSPAFNSENFTGNDTFNSRFTETGMDIEEVISTIKKNIDLPGLNPASHGHLGYIPGGGIYYSAVADYIAAITNRYAGLYYASPGAVKLENNLIQWLGELIGWKDGFSGNLSSGGSISNLIGIIAARDAHKVVGSNSYKNVIYTSSQQHHCLGKAIHIAGLDECVHRSLPLNENHQIISSELSIIIQKDIAAGLSPFLVIASAGTTDTGTIDPLNEIGNLAKKYNFWFHVDAAYGGFFIMCKNGHSLMKGINKADSVVMDPHKGLFLPYGLGVVLIKNKNHLINSFGFQANYMQDSVEGTELSPASLSPELTKHFRGLRLWLPLRLHGTAPFKAALEEKLLLAQYFYSELSKISQWEMFLKPELSVVVYRYLPRTGDINEFNRKLIKAIQDDGRVFLSSTFLDGKFLIRLAVLSFRTHLKTIDFTIKMLKESAHKLEQTAD